MDVTAPSISLSTIEVRVETELPLTYLKIYINRKGWRGKKAKTGTHKYKITEQWLSPNTHLLSAHQKVTFKNLFN